MHKVISYLYNRLPCWSFLFGINEKLELSYNHTWYDIQIHCLKIGFFYIEWKGYPWLDCK